MHTYGDGGSTPVVGDWNNDGIDTIGLYRDGEFKIRLVSEDPASEQIIDFGNLGQSYKPLAGSFDGGADKVGIINEYEAMYVKDNTAAYYPLNEVHSELVYATGLAFSYFDPIVVDLPYYSATDPMEHDDLAYVAPPAIDDYDLCPATNSCRWIDQIDAIGTPNEGNQTEIPTPQPL